MEKYVLVLVILIFSAIGYLKLAVKYKIIDKPNQRSSHSKITVRGGGIIFTIAIVLFWFFNNFQYTYFVLGVAIISIVSFLDDIYTLSSKIRFPFQLVAILCVLYQFGVPVNPIYIFAFFLVFGVGIINMFNFMDGINGITGMYSLAVLLGFYAINANEHIINSDLLVYSGLSLLVFGFYNFRRKALFFAGDIGSITLGMLVFFLVLYFSVQLASPLIIFMVVVYGADSLLTLLYRKMYTKESVLDPHRHHIYQKLVDTYGISHIKIAVSYALLQLAVNVVIFKTYTLALTHQMIILISIMLFFILVYMLLFAKMKKKEIAADAN